MTESEVNSFLEFHARNEMPAGVLEPVVTIEEAGRLTGRALVDLDEVKKANAGEGGLGMLALLSGRVPVEATGTLRTADGVAQFELEQALRERRAGAEGVAAAGGQLLLAQPGEPRRASTSRRRSRCP